MPDGHEKQSSMVPLRLENLPAGHVAHRSPSLTWKLPGAQRVQDDCPKGLSKPGGQALHDPSKLSCSWAGHSMQRSLPPLVPVSSGRGANEGQRELQPPDAKRAPVVQRT